MSKFFIFKYNFLNLIFNVPHFGIILFVLNIKLAPAFTPVLGQMYCIIGIGNLSYILTTVYDNNYYIVQLLHNHNQIITFFCTF
jgi:hypothetical protein